jgi:hypothetical protein
MAPMNNIIVFNRSETMHAKTFSGAIPGTNGSGEKMQIRENGFVSQRSLNSYHQSQSKNQENSDPYFHVLLRT